MKPVGYKQPPRPVGHLGKDFPYHWRQLGPPLPLSRRLRPRTNARGNLQTRSIRRRMYPRVHIPAHTTYCHAQSACPFLHITRQGLTVLSDVHEAELRAFAAQVYNISEGDLSLDEIMLSTDLKFRVTSFLRQLGRGHGFVAFELVEGAVMVKGGFTVENGLRMADGIVSGRTDQVQQRA